MGRATTWSKPASRQAVRPKGRHTYLVLLVQLYHALEAARLEQVLGSPLDLSQGRLGQTADAVWGKQDVHGGGTTRVGDGEKRVNKDRRWRPRLREASEEASRRECNLSKVPTQVCTKRLWVNKGDGDDEARRRETTDAQVKLARGAPCVRRQGPGGGVGARQFDCITLAGDATSRADHYVPPVTGKASV